MPFELSQVVTFATDPRHGNPVFVLRTEALPEPETATGICRLLGADFLVALVDDGSDRPSMASFTPQGAHPGAGHGTHAAASLAFQRPDVRRDAIEFQLPGGGVRAARRDAAGRVAVDWPAMPFETIDLRDSLAAALGSAPAETFAAPFGHIALLESEAAIAALTPDLDRVSALGRPAVIAVAPGTASDIVVRVFAPNVGLPEDPVCGTAHRILSPLWSERLGKTTIHSRHLSPRGGDLWCTAAGDTVSIAGEAVVTLRGDLHFPGAAPERTALRTAGAGA
ncbi:MAG: PhzF family phenazine biosynthesis protein [Rhizobiales bacterium]|nr:PhzF family phenazine biosynthesis protein [Hyphomicrobiales bacterium]